MEGTTTLADSLLDDLDDLSDVVEDEEHDDDDDGGGGEDPSSSHGNDEKDEPPDGTHASAIDAPPGVKSQPQKSSANLNFLENHSLQKHLATIRKRAQFRSPSNDNSTATPTGSQKEIEAEDHQLVVQSNKLLANLSEEMARAHAELAKAYQAKFPELEELLPNAVQYKNAVRIIGNEMDLTKVNDKLGEVLGSNQIITIAVAASSSSGRILSESELKEVDTAAGYIERLIDVQAELQGFVENSMEAIAPSVCALVGPSIAAKILGLAGGLAELTKIPACNLQVIGQVKQNSTSRAGMSGATVKQHTGILAECDFVEACPKPLKKKALKAVASKLALAARFDFVNVDTGRPRSAQAGMKFRQELNEKFVKLQEPDKAPTLKALPKPDLTVKKRRGGKRIRRWKERFEETEMMKKANTRAFSSQSGEYGDDAMGISMGLLNTDGGGSVRKVTEKRKMRQANTKASRKRAAQMAQRAQNKDGLASSVVFTQTDAMELVNPDANKERVKDANRRWFSENSGFQSAKK